VDYVTVVPGKNGTAAMVWTPHHTGSYSVEIVADRKPFGPIMPLLIEVVD